MADYRLKINEREVRKFLRSREVEAELLRIGRQVESAAGPGHTTESWQGFDRVHVSVRTVTPEAMLAEATDRTLTRAIDAGRS